jgi:hypothetical protein
VYPTVDVARHLTREELDAGVAGIRQSPADRGSVELIVRRPSLNEREVLEEGELDLELGLVGDTWHRRASSRMPDKSPHPGMQINLMNARAIGLIAGERARWPLAGDQLYVDLDLSVANLPPGTRLAIGGAVLEVTEIPHTGCAKFVSRFGLEAMKFVNSPLGRQLNLRGINARVLVPGRIRVGDPVVKLPVAAAAVAGV